MLASHQARVRCPLRLLLGFCLLDIHGLSDVVPGWISSW
jgi:hypothetical protein